MRVAGATALCVLWLCAACSSGSSSSVGSDPSVGEETTSSTTPAPTAAPSQSASPAAQAGAIADVPAVEIARQLARRAERIAKNIPMVPAPADVDPGTNRAIGYQEMIDFGFPADQWAYLDALWQRESGWNHLAENPSSGAYGIPQSLPATKMAVVGSDWRTNPVTQIRWGLAYIAARYGTAQKAWQHSERTGWY